MNPFSKIFRPIKRRINSLLEAQAFKKRATSVPSYPINKEGKVFIHLGCGEINSPEFINIDARPYPHVHIITDDLIAGLDNFSDNSADLIYMSHILEHISHKKIADVLKKIWRKLKTSGCLRVGVPDFDCICAIYQDTDKIIKNIVMPLMGGQDYPYNFSL